MADRITVTCPKGSFRASDGRCIPFNVLMGDEVTIFQGPDCWPKQFTLRKPFDPRLKEVLLAAIRRETRGLKPTTLSRKVAASPHLSKRVKAARAVRRHK